MLDARPGAKLLFTITTKRKAVCGRDCDTDEYSHDPSVDCLFLACRIVAG